MYVYLLIAKQDDEISTYRPLLAIAENQKRAEFLLIQERKNWPEVEVVRKRVNCKDKFFVVFHEFDEADSTFYDFVHLTTSEKRATGFIENQEAQKYHARGTLVVRERLLD